MADNTDSLPLFFTNSPVHFLNDKVIVGSDNTVSETAENVIVNGKGNYIGAYCKDISLFNCSGCIVEPYSSGVIMLASSGVVATTSNLMVLSNVLVNAYSFENDSNSHKIITDDYTIGVNDKCIIASVFGITITIPTFTDFGYTQTVDDIGNYQSGGKVITIKNMTNSNIFLETSATGEFDQNDVSSPKTLSANESITLLITQIDSQDTVLIL
jgi:hypothetical protein